ncbi:MAG: carboxymuconolactone decarboxylase family protein [bacterium]
MPRIQPIDPSAATAEAATHLATAAKMFGGTPNFALTAANSPATLNALLSLFANIGATSLGATVGEQIAIAVAESNGSGYCLSAHTAIGTAYGIHASELEAARRGTSADPKTNAILRLAADINNMRGDVTNSALDAARNAGISDTEIVEVVGHVALNVFTNFLNNVSQMNIDFPEVAPYATA